MRDSISFNLSFNSSLVSIITVLPPDSLQITNNLFMDIIHETGGCWPQHKESGHQGKAVNLI